MTVHIKHDLLGNREIPAEVCWNIHALRAVENFKIPNQKISDASQFVRSMVMVKKATAQANGKLDAIKPEITAAIEKACDEVLLKGRYLDQFPLDVYRGGAGVSVNMNTNEVIANLALGILDYEKGRYDIVNPMDHVSASQSTSDAYPTGFELAVYYGVGELLEKLALLRDAFTAETGEFKDVLKMGRTQLQDAVPVAAGQGFRSFQVLLEEEILNLDRAHALLLKVNLGATTIGAGVNISKGCAALAVKKLPEINGLDCKLTENLIEATSNYGAYVTIHGALKRTAVKLLKICNDLRLLSSGSCTDLKKINLPEMQAGSSIIPVKVNPVIPEVANQVCFKVVGNDTTIIFAAEAGQLQLNVVEPVVVQYVSETISLLDSAAVDPAEKCVRDITVNCEIYERHMFNSIGLVTYLNPCIGYSNDDLVDKTCAQTDKGIREVVLERDLLNEAELDRILLLEDLVNLHRGTRFGLK